MSSPGIGPVEVPAGDWHCFPDEFGGWVSSDEMSRLAHNSADFAGFGLNVEFLTTISESCLKR